MDEPCSLSYGDLLVDAKLNRLNHYEIMPVDRLHQVALLLLFVLLFPVDSVLKLLPLKFACGRRQCSGLINCKLLYLIKQPCSPALKPVAQQVVTRCRVQDFGILVDHYGEVGEEMVGRLEKIKLRVARLSVL